LLDTASKEKLDGILSKYKKNKDELITILEEVQDEFSYLSLDAMLEVSKYLRIPESNIFGVATFYALFKLKPSGKKIIRVCRGTACHVKGGARIISELEQRLGIKAGETTADGEYTLETVACIGACALAPNITIGKDLYGLLTPQKVAEVFSARKD
jgi:NADH-quinone oxidoreductase subunit E